MKHITAMKCNVNTTEYTYKVKLDMAWKGISQSTSYFLKSMPF